MSNKTNQGVSAPCPLAVMDKVACVLVGLSPADDKSPAARDLREARAAVADLVKALRESDEWIRTAKEIGCNLSAENTLLNNRAALAKFGGAL